MQILSDEKLLNQITLLDLKIGNYIKPFKLSRFHTISEALEQKLLYRVQ